MSDQDKETDMSCSIWQSQSIDASNISLESVRRQLEKRRRSMNSESNMFFIIATLACGMSTMSGFKCLAATNGNPTNLVFGLSALLFSLALIAAVVYTQRRLRVRKFEIESPAGGMAVYRAELERLIRAAYREWHVLVFFVPSYLVLLIGGLIVDQRPGKFMRYTLTVVAGAVSVGFTLWVGRKKSRCLQRDLDAIKSM